MIERLQNITAKYQELVEELTHEDVLQDYNKLRKLSKEKADLEEIVLKYKEYQKCDETILEAKEMLNDSDLKDLAEEEIATATANKEKLEKELQLLLIPKDANDDKNIILEIRGAAGGDEANIFAGDLYRMYTRYAEKNNWKIEVLHEIEGSAGGYSQIEFMIRGENVYSKLKFESGSHRVQRVPVTEAGGRVHTSTATVLVMPEVNVNDVEIKETDLKIDNLITVCFGCDGKNIILTFGGVGHLIVNNAVVKDIVLLGMMAVAIKTELQTGEIEGVIVEHLGHIVVKLL